LLGTEHEGPIRPATFIFRHRDALAERKLSAGAIADSFDVTAPKDRAARSWAGSRRHNGHTAPASPWQNGFAERLLSHPNEW
jgi:hypothetical protein